MTVDGKPRPELLAAIVAATKTAVQERAVSKPLRELEKARGQTIADGARFIAALRKEDRYNVIAE